jgi:hypothetical protein
MSVIYCLSSQNWTEDLGFIACLTLSDFINSGLQSWLLHLLQTFVGKEVRKFAERTSLQCVAKISLVTSSVLHWHDETLGAHNSQQISSHFLNLYIALQITYIHTFSQLSFWCFPTVFLVGAMTGALEQIWTWIGFSDNLLSS